MTYTEFKRQLGKAGLTVRAFAALMGQTPNSITNYASKGQVPTHLAIIATLMAEMVDAGIDFRLALRRGGLLVSESESNTGESN
ncbi:XRE family transcriptional regulator [Thiomonas sp.]|uniref:XRE family transcriptional regulator n=1 Tax=Thiomonas sp. TaxID=2047785 RepID=UPI002582CED9|nr:XRE family transcriptional regulator [Thiomonas sp.]